MNIALYVMNDIEEFKELANEVEHLCTHISVRKDENGPYIFALDLKNTHITVAQN